MKLKFSNLLCFCRNEQRAKGFSLIELLVTVGAVCMLFGFLLPGVVSVTSSREFSRNAYEIAEVLKYAQAEARSKQSFVRVGFMPCEIDGQRAIKVAAFIAADGSGENIGTDNMLLLSRIVLVKNMALVPWSELGSSTRALNPGGTPVSLEANRIPTSFLSARGTTFEHMITFTPRGEALLKGAVSPSDGYNSLIDVSLRQTRGTTILSDGQDAAILVDGSTGNSSVLRL